MYYKDKHEVGRMCGIDTVFAAEYTNFPETLTLSCASIYMYWLEIRWRIHMCFDHFLHVTGIRVVFGMY